MSKKWYVVHTYSGHENKVKVNLEKAIHSAGLAESFGQILVATEEFVEMKDGKRKTSKRKTRSNSSAQGIRVGAFTPAGAAAREDAVAAGALEACGAACSRDGTTSLRQAALGAKTPWKRTRW